MELKLDDLDPREALRYMGYHGQALDQDMEERLEQARQTVLQTARPAAVYRHTAMRLVEEGVCLDAFGLLLPGEALKRHLTGCGGAVLFCVTLGADVERALRREQLRDRANALMLDACASAAVERGCDLLCASLEEQYCPDGCVMTARFSPGYADLPITLQKQICQTLDTQKKIGVCVNAGGILTPRKSVTAIVGIRKGTGKGELSGCGNCQSCPRAGVCPFSREAGGSRGAQKGDRE